MSAAQGPAYDVGVVGLGPTGLTLAHLLATRGLSVLVLEREPAFYGMARAVYTDDECLRILQTAGVADDVHADMMVDLPVQWLRADRSVLTQFRTTARPQGWPVSNFLYQPFFENTLERRLAEHPSVTVRRGRAVVGFDQDADGVTVHHVHSAGTAYGRDEETAPASPIDGALDGAVDGTGAPESTRISYLVAADGGRSGVRASLGIEMEGRSFPQRWLVIDLKAKDGVDAFGHLPYFDFVCDPELPTVSCPQPDNRHRFEFMLSDDDESEEFERLETARRLMSGYVDVDDVEIDRQLVYTFNALVAKEWRRGRVFLAGDAAHMTPQFIGQGMNAGLRDADNLSWKLADVNRRGAADSLLDSYQSERQPHATAMINLSVLNKDIVSTGSPLGIRARDLGIGLAARTPGVRSFLTEAKVKPKPRYRHGSYVGLPRRLGGTRGVEGTLMPQVPVRTQAGRPVRLDDALGAGWVVLGVEIDPRGALAAGPWEQLGATWAVLYQPGARPQGGHLPRPRTAGDQAHGSETPLVDLEAVDDELSCWLAKAGAARGSVIVLRPDKYVFSVTRPGDHETAVRELTRQVGVASS